MASTAVWSYEPLKDASEELELSKAELQKLRKKMAKLEEKIACLELEREEQSGREMEIKFSKEVENNFKNRREIVLKGAETERKTKVTRTNDDEEGVPLGKSVSTFLPPPLKRFDELQKGHLSKSISTKTMSKSHHYQPPPLKRSDHGNFSSPIPNNRSLSTDGAVKLRRDKDKDKERERKRKKKRRSNTHHKKSKTPPPGGSSSSLKKEGGKSAGEEEFDDVPDFLGGGGGKSAGEEEFDDVPDFLGGGGRKSAGEEEFDDVPDFLGGGGGKSGGEEEFDDVPDFLGGGGGSGGEEFDDVPDFLGGGGRKSGEFDDVPDFLGGGGGGSGGEDFDDVPDFLGGGGSFDDVPDFLGSEGEFDAPDILGGAEDAPPNFDYDAPKKVVEEETPEFIESMKMHDWTTRFQTVIKSLRELPYTDESNLEARVEANQELMHLSQDFIQAAKTYGRIIISEVYLPLNKKTITPINLGGVAGGEKYIVHNILFKFALDSSGLFGGDNLAAAKVGGLELKGLMSYFSIGLNDINLPMMALVDYRGFRLIAMSVLPIQGKSLIYGSKDAGLTVHASNEKFNELMATAGKRLNLAPHLCGTDPDNELKELWGACDIEGHMGTDGKFYLLDFSRTMPPTPPQKGVIQGHLYRLFRREFVQSYPYPLSSDGFTGFSMHDPKFKEHNEQLKQAHKHLLYDVIPAFAKQFLKILEKKSPKDVSVAREMHTRGINLRYLGYVYNAIYNAEHYCFLSVSNVAPIARRLVLIEACARTLKNKLKIRLQEKMKELRLPLEIPYKQEILKLVNMWFEEDGAKESISFWDGEEEGGMKEALRKGFGFSNFGEYDSSRAYDRSWKPMSVSIRKGHVDFLKTMEKSLENNRASKTPPLNALKDSTNLALSNSLKDSAPDKKANKKSGNVGSTTDKKAYGTIGEKQKKRRSTFSPQFKKNTIEKEKGKEEEEEKYSSLPMIEVQDCFAIGEKSPDNFSLKKCLFFEKLLCKDVNLGGRYFLFQRFITLAGLKITDGALKRFSGEKGFRFNPKEPLSLLDLEAMEGRVKHMNIVSAAAGTFFQHKGLAEKEFAAGHFREAIERYEESLEADPQDKSVLFSAALTWYKLLRELSGKKDQKGQTQAIFQLEDSGVIRTIEYFLDAIEFDPDNRLALCSFAELTAQCGLYETAEEYFLRALELDPHYSYALVQYGNFLCQRNIALVGQMFLDRGGQAAGKEGAINALTGKQVGGAVMVYFPDGTKKTVGATPATSSVDLMESLQAIFLKTKGKSAKPADIELINAQFRVLVLHERTKERERPMKDTEKPWLLLQKPGQKSELVACPLRQPPVSSTVSIMEHYLEITKKLMPPDSPFEPPALLAEFETAHLQEMKTFATQTFDPIFRAKNLSALRKHVHPPSKKQHIEWIAYNMCVLGRISLSLFAFVSNFCESQEMRVSENTEHVVAWMRKGHEGVKENVFVSPKDFALNFKGALVQMVQTSFQPALTHTIKPKKFLSDMSVFSSRAMGIILHVCFSYQQLAKNISVWEIPVVPLVMYAFHICSENGLIDKKIDHDIYAGYAELGLD